jgi:hypothetical protein
MDGQPPREAAARRVRRYVGPGGSPVTTGTAATVAIGLPGSPRTRTQNGTGISETAYVLPYQGTNLYDVRPESEGTSSRSAGKAPSLYDARFCRIRCACRRVFPPPQGAQNDRDQERCSSLWLVARGGNVGRKPLTSHLATVDRRRCLLVITDGCGSSTAIRSTMLPGCTAEEDRQVLDDVGPRNRVAVRRLSPVRVHNDRGRLGLSSQERVGLSQSLVQDG